MSMSVCFTVSLSVRIITRKPRGHCQIFMHVACSHGSVLLGRRGDALSTSGFVDDVFSYYEPESSTTLYVEEICRVAVPVGRQTTRCLVEFVRSECGTGAKSVIYDCLVTEK